MPGAAAAAAAEAPHAREERSLAEVEAGEPNRLSGAVRADALRVLVARPRPRGSLEQASPRRTSSSSWDSSGAVCRGLARTRG